MPLLQTFLEVRPPLTKAIRVQMFSLSFLMRGLPLSPKVTALPEQRILKFNLLDSLSSKGNEFSSSSLSGTSPIELFYLFHLK